MQGHTEKEEAIVEPSEWWLGRSGERARAFGGRKYANIKYGFSRNQRPTRASASTARVAFAGPTPTTYTGRFGVAGSDTSCGYCEERPGRRPFLPLGDK